jgi:hypothetical protein
MIIQHHALVVSVAISMTSPAHCDRFQGYCILQANQREPRHRIPIEEVIGFQDFDKLLGKCDDRFLSPDMMQNLIMSIEAYSDNITPNLLKNYQQIFNDKFSQHLAKGKKLNEDVNCFNAQANTNPIQEANLKVYIDEFNREQNEINIQIALINPVVALNNDSQSTLIVCNYLKTLSAYPFYENY